jgi:hypothetical protein
MTGKISDSGIIFFGNYTFAALQKQRPGSPKRTTLESLSFRSGRDRKSFPMKIANIGATKRLPQHVAVITACFLIGRVRCAGGLFRLVRLFLRTHDCCKPLSKVWVERGAQARQSLSCPWPWHEWWEDKKVQPIRRHLGRGSCRFRNDLKVEWGVIKPFSTPSFPITPTCDEVMRCIDLLAIGLVHMPSL